MSISEGGLVLNRALDGMDVESRWLAGEYVDWRDGATLPWPPPTSEGYENDTHCSAFAAAVALRLDVALLSPPPERYLANRQAEWLQAGASGWLPVSGPVDAQQRANMGHLVLISYLNPNSQGSGHIQVVRAFDGRSPGELALVGPQVIQAGRVNFNSVTAAEGFSSGYALSYPYYPWPDNVTYFAFAIAG